MMIGDFDPSKGQQISAENFEQRKFEQMNNIYMSEYDLKVKKSGQNPDAYNPRQNKNTSNDIILVNIDPKLSDKSQNPVHLQGITINLEQRESISEGVIERNTSGEKITKIQNE